MTSEQPAKQHCYRPMTQPSRAARSGSTASMRHSGGLKRPRLKVPVFQTAQPAGTCATSLRMAKSQRMPYSNSSTWTTRRRTIIQRQKDKLSLIIRVISRRPNISAKRNSFYLPRKLAARTFDLLLTLSAWPKKPSL